MTSASTDATSVQNGTSVGVDLFNLTVYYKDELFV